MDELFMPLIVANRANNTNKLTLIHNEKLQGCLNFSLLLCFTRQFVTAGFTIADLMKGSLALNLSERSLLSTTARLEGVKQKSTIFCRRLEIELLRQN